MGSAVPIFHLFSFLPFELRREIYILATPPRIVHVREAWDFEKDADFRKAYNENNLCYEQFKYTWALEKFSERYETKPLQTNLHPDLAYFAHNWRHRIPFRSTAHTQTCLESYGFTSKVRPYQPWPPTRDTPEIPLCWLEDNVAVAFELIRESYIYSKAPIPPFLHTCTESRKVLMDFGYQIVFGTRTRPPRTWFHFSRDRLYTAERFPHWHQGLDYGNLLSASWWDPIGQMDVKDLQQIKKLVIGRGNRAVNDLPIHLEGILLLLPNLQELFFEEWDWYSIHHWFGSADERHQPEAQGHQNNETLTDHGAKELWKCVPIEEVDVVVQILCYHNTYDFPGRICVVGDSLHSFNMYKDGGPRNLSFFESMATRFQEDLSLRRDSQKGDWNIPKIKFVHICSEATAKRFVHGRLAFWHHYNEVKKAFARDKPFKPLTVDGPTPPPPFRIHWCRDGSWHQLIEAEKWNAFELHNIGPYNEDPTNEHLRGWYLTRGSAMKPGLEIIF
ncbi:hypothetical protein F4677DRAFT_404472 [Hypoxylon crocopeplum]|nr:hypothetical protein F4677DRAFT_404472 [Hypoxylon crocopeplum]